MHCDPEFDPARRPGRQAGWNRFGGMATRLWLGTPESRRHFARSSLSQAESARYRGLRRPGRIEDFEVSRALLSHAENSALQTCSLSHSGGYAALLQASMPLRAGVDIQAHRARDLLGIANFTFNFEEIEALEATGEAARERLF